MTPAASAMSRRLTASKPRVENCSSAIPRMSERVCSLRSCCACRAICICPVLDRIPGLCRPRGSAATGRPDPLPRAGATSWPARVGENPVVVAAFTRLTLTLKTIIIHSDNYLAETVRLTVQAWCRPVPFIRSNA
ncbi:hypothetical protein BCEP4_1130007 [Burkholderia cepacia]|nr:hypothetical protein BCEP4_1130007 [Burkholderia cepacia]